MHDLESYVAQYTLMIKIVNNLEPTSDDEDEASAFCIVGPNLLGTFFNALTVSTSNIKLVLDEKKEEQFALFKADIMTSLIPRLNALVQEQLRCQQEIENCKVLLERDPNNRAIQMKLDRNQTNWQKYVAERTTLWTELLGKSKGQVLFAEKCSTLYDLDRQQKQVPEDFFLYVLGEKSL